MAGKKILLVDDEEDIIAPIKFFLEKNGYEVIVAHNGKEALEKIQKLPDLVLLDVIMPVMDGFEVLRRMQNDPATSKIPVIMLTCRTDTPDIFRAKNIKATDYVLKTSSLEDLLVLLKKYLEKDKLKPVQIKFNPFRI